MIIATNYADKKFKKAQKLNSKTARAHGADKVIEYGPEDIDRDFYEKNREILANPRGGGYYLWKPYFYRKAYGMPLASRLKNAGKQAIHLGGAT